MKKLKIGVFGAHRGKTMMHVLLRHPEAELVAVCDKYCHILPAPIIFLQNFHTFHHLFCTNYLYFFTKLGIEEWLSKG